MKILRLAIMVAVDDALTVNDVASHLIEGLTALAPDIGKGRVHWSTVEVRATVGTGHKQSAEHKSRRLASFRKTLAAKAMQ